MNDPPTLISEMFFQQAESQAAPSPPPLPPPMICIHETPAQNTLAEKSAVLFSLTQAIEEDSVHKMKTLIEDKGVDKNQTLSYGVSILLSAVRNRSVNVVDYLINIGADPESSVCDLMRAPDGLEAAYHQLSRYDRWSVGVIKQLLPKLGAERLHGITDSFGRSLLYLACYFPDLSIFEYLLDLGLNPNNKDMCGTSVLSRVISHSDSYASLRMMQRLLDKPDIQVDIPNSYGHTPLFQSFVENRLEIFYLLLRKGANPLVKTHLGNTLMHWPFLHANKYMILHDLGLHANAKNRSGGRPLQNKVELDFDFFILVLLGREVTDSEYKKMENAYKSEIVECIRERVDSGEFSSIRLKHLCRRSIRRQLFRVCPYTVTERIWKLPLPRPLLLYLDVILYAKHMLAD